MALLLVAAIGPMLRNESITDSPFGTAFLTLYGGLGSGSESAVMRTIDLEAEPLVLDGLISKILRTTLLQATDIIPFLGGIVIAPLFFISLLHPFKRAAIANFRWAVLLMWVSAAFGLAFFGISKNELDPNQLHLLFAPIMMAYGLAFISILWSRLDFVATTPILRNVHHFVIIGICALPLVLAQTARLSGRIHLAQKSPDYQKAVDQFGEAIRRASPLLTKQSPALQAAAREVLLDAHLGTAQSIAQGTWQQKSRVIPKWMARSEAVVAECKAEQTVQQTLELQLCRGALAVAAGSADSFEPLPWVKRLLEVRDRMGETVKDPWRRRQIDWEVGLGLLDALAAAQLRGDASDMLDNATLTAAYLERGGEQRELTDKERKNAGDLLFRIGIMHSLQRGDHATAVTWFDRVIPMWEGNPRLDRDREAGQLGESYVSMAISYWQVDRRDDAMALSRRGVDLMVAAVDSKQLEERSLAVAYGNLSTMYAEQGDDTQSQTYAEMASRAEASGSIVR